MWKSARTRIRPAAFLAAAVLFDACSKSSAGAAPTVPTPQNHPPTIGSIAVSPGGLGMAGATTYDFAAQDAADVDGNPLTFAWTFGDGTTATGAKVSHVYGQSASYTVNVSVSDGITTVNAPGTTLTVAPSMAAAGWGGGGQLPIPIMGVTMVQNGTALKGSIFINGAPLPPILWTGTVNPLTYPTTITFDWFDGLLSWSFTGQTDASGNTLSGTMLETTPCPVSPFNVCNPNTPRPVTYKRCGSDPSPFTTFACALVR